MQQPDRTPFGEEVVSHREILGMRVDATSYEHASDTVLDWSRHRWGRYVCIANVHMTMEAWDEKRFGSIVNSADLVTPDGMPLVWALRLLGVDSPSRVYGPTLMLHVCEKAAAAGVPIGLYGGKEETLPALREKLLEMNPRLRITYSFSPPFRELTEAEDDQVVEELRRSGARILFVGLGCPKQEVWMARHRDRLDLVQLGVGAAFDFHAGNVRQAPAGLQKVGLEWLFRLLMEPKRLARRYFRHNPRFVWFFVRQLLRERGRPREPARQG